MALNINGYNTDFNAFVEFAQNSFVTNDKTAVARFEVGGAPLGGRLIVAANPQFDKVGKFRNQTQKDLNNEIRTAFRNAIIDMFGGESRIPDSVKDAMLLKDYDKGKPLTARRIMAVKAAIDKDGSVKLNTFRFADAATVALNKGWTNAELPKIARAARFLSDATGVDEFTAIEQLSTPGSKANRLMNYGGRFMDSATSFANGLRLMDSFKDWYTNIFNTMKPVHKQERNVRDFSPADTFTKLNIDSNFIDMDYLQGFEKFAFEELAANPKANLAETDMEKLFGFKDNKAMAFIGTGYGNSFYSTIANVPKEKRAIIYTALNAFTVPAKNAQEAHNKNMGNGSYTKLSSNHAPVVIARLVKNFDKAEAMFNAGKLTAKNIIKEFFSEIPEKGDYDYKTLNNYFDGIETQLALDEDEGGKYTDVSGSVVLAMQNSGCTFEETVQMLRQGQMPPVPKFLSTGSMRLKDFDGTVNGGRDLIGGDLNRPDFCYRFKSNLEKPLLAPGPQQPGFGFKFPDEGKFFTNASEQGKANITRVADKVVAMCGSVHVAQSNAVMTMLSQSGLSNLRGGLPQIGVTSNEHAPVDYTITKNDETGDITIKYTSPEALPFKFEWTATVDISGNVTTTPMTVEMKAAGAENAAARMNVNLTDAQKAKADTLIADLGSKHNLTGKKLDMFSNFVVSLKLTDASAAKDLDVASDMAKNIAAWDTFELGKGSVTGITDALTTTFNELIDEAMDDAAKGPGASSKFSNDRDVSQDMYTDAHRLNFSFNGTSVKGDPGSPQKVIDAFKKTVANPAMRRGLSSILHQTAILAFTSLSNRATLPSTTQHKTGIDSKNLQGIEKMVSRDAGSGKYSMMTTDKKEGEPIRYDLTVSEDGKSATLTVSEKSNLVTGAGRNDMAVYGTVKNTMSFQIDLTGEKPVIVSTSIGQDFAAA